jgi:hypothetical protein
MSELSIAYLVLLIGFVVFTQLTVTIGVLVTQHLFPWVTLSMMAVGFSWAWKPILCLVVVFYLWYRGITPLDILWGYTPEAIISNVTARSNAYSSYRMERLRRLGVSQRTTGIFEMLGDAALEEMCDEDISNTHVGFAMKWSRRARVFFSYPKDSPANRKLVSKWIQEEWTKKNVRTAHIMAALPLAISLTFVRDRHEQFANEVERSREYQWFHTGTAQA